jgi:hypothetical protein
MERGLNEVAREGFASHCSGSNIGVRLPGSRRLLQQQGAPMRVPDCFSRLLLTAAAVVMVAGPAWPGERIGVRIGMSMSEIEDYLNRECADLVIGGAAEKFITCHLKDGDIVTANLSPKGRITYSVYRENDAAITPEQFAAEVSSELGYEGPGRQCRFYSTPALCWMRGTTELKVERDRDSRGWLSSYQIDEKMTAEDAE